MIKSIIEELQLNNCKNYKISKLSISDKRKVCVGVCLIGKKSVLIFDEPTEGMNENDKEITWNVIRNLRENRIIILSTNSIIEAHEVCDEMYEIHDKRLFKINNGAFPKEIIQEEEEKAEENENMIDYSDMKIIINKHKKLNYCFIIIYIIALLIVFSHFDNLSIVYYLLIYIYIYSVKIMIVNQNMSLAVIIIIIIT